MDRKNFLKTATAAALFCSWGGITACTSQRLITGRHKGGSLQVAKSMFQEDPFILVRHPEKSAPIFLMPDDESDSYVAILLECTHRQCTVSPEGETLKCPCHGSRFDQKGAVLEGPARRSLPRFTVRTDPEHIYIELP